MLLTIFLLLSLIFARPCHAETMYSPNFQLRFGNFNMTSGTKASGSYSLTDTVGQTFANEFTSVGYSTFAGAQYAYTLYDFGFSVSKTSVDLGSLIAGNFASNSLNLIVSAPRQGYTITTAASSRMKSNTDFIANTVCDSGCTKTLAGAWTSAASYGFGYNMSGDDVVPDFAGPTFFRPFPDFSVSDAPATIMTTVESGLLRTATATYQVALDPDQAVGAYETLIYYIATPNY
ncbi:MAG: hypothetical protein WCL07_01135 [bacterium]